MKARGDACSFAFFEEVTRPFPRHLYGPGNEGIGEWTTGKVPYSQLIHELQMNRVYFYTGTHPASYTLNFMEAWMVGIPVVAIGSDHGNSKAFINHNLYEVPSFIKNGINGFCSDNIEELRSYIKELLNNDSLAKSISEEGRKEAIVHFGKANIKNQWKEFLEK
jgi:glycosyltransferase involved in cell wall biosynthesis